jgi:hypothetical protein
MLPDPTVLYAVADRHQELVSIEDRALGGHCR